MSLKSGVGGAAQGAALGSAVLPGIGTAIGGIGGLLSGLFGGDDNNDAAAQAQQNAIDAINSLDVDDLSKQVMLQQYQQNGKLDPAMVQHLNLNADQKNILTENPANRNNQQYTMEALKQLSQNGMSPEDLAQLQQSRSGVAEDTNAKTNQILQQAQMRGTASGGDTLAAQLMANQQGSQQASHDALNTAAAAAQARQQALSNYGNMAGQVRSQDYATQQANQANELARQRFLDTNSLARQTANVGAQNQANLYNLQRQQGVGDTNVGAANAEAQRSANLKANLAEGKASALAGQYQKQVGTDQTASTNAANANSNFWSGVTGTAQSLGKGGAFDFLKPSTTDTSSHLTTGSGGQQYLGFGPSMSEGGEVEGPEIEHGDSPANDVVPVMASAGELVIPKSKMKDPDSAKSFIDKHFGTKKAPKSNHEHLLDLIAELHAKKSKE